MTAVVAEPASRGLDCLSIFISTNGYIVGVFSPASLGLQGRTKQDRDDDAEAQKSVDRH